MFTLLKDALGVGENFRSTNGVRFSWDNRRDGQMRALARLDRCYVFLQVGAGAEPVTEYLIKGDCYHSDHLPVLCSVQLQLVPKRNSAYKMSSLYLKNPEVAYRVKRIWNQNPRSGFTAKLRRVVKFYRNFCVAKAGAFRAEELGLRQVVADATAELHNEPEDELLQERLGEAGEKLKLVEQRQAEGQRIRSRVKWKRVGDACTAEFFRASKAHSGASNITSLEDEDGSLHSDQQGLERICTEFYTKLYTANPGSAEQADAATQALATMSDRLSEDMKVSLRAPMTMEELSKALSEMANGKAPGPDGVLTEFFKEYWDTIKADYLEMINLAAENQQFPPGVTRGLISLLHKAETRSRLTNWRPITLLNVAYKLYAKAL